MRQTYKLPHDPDVQHIAARMAAACHLRVVEQTPTRITVEGREADQTVFADRLEQLLRLCR